jgi:hypothetical protein
MLFMATCPEHRASLWITPPVVRRGYAPARSMPRSDFGAESKNRRVQSNAAAETRRKVKADQPLR